MFIVAEYAALIVRVTAKKIGSHSLSTGEGSKGQILSQF